MSAAPPPDPLAAPSAGKRRWVHPRWPEPPKERESKRVANAGRANATLWHDGRGKAYATVRVGGHVEHWAVRSRQFARLLLRAYYMTTGETPRRESLAEAQDLLEAEALFGGEERSIHNRVARGPDGAYYYDLSDPGWRAVRITGEGWSIVPEPPVAFRRYAHMRAQVEPVRGGQVSDIFRYIHIAGEDDRIIVAAKLVTDLVPDIPHPILNCYGSQGATKTTSQRMLRRIVDPSNIELLSMPRDPAEMLQQLDHHYAPVYDNVRDLQPWQSDTLCRASSGEGASKRELYTDDEDILRSFRRVVSINGINMSGESPDYLDRSILIGLERVPRERRRPERTIWGEFVAALPRILGAVFDALAGAIRLYPTVEEEMKELPRMADFTLWGEAASRAMGYPPRAFLAAYNRSIEARNREAIESSPTGAAVLRLLEVGTEEDPGPLDRWEGTAGDLLRALRAHAEGLGVDLRSREWPKSPKALGKRLRAIRANLEEEGLRVEFRREETAARERIITITRRGAGDSGKNVQNVQNVQTDNGSLGRLLDKSEATNVREMSNPPDSDFGQVDVLDVSARTSNPLKTRPLYPGSLPEPAEPPPNTKAPGGPDSERGAVALQNGEDVERGVSGGGEGPAKCPLCGQIGYLVPGGRGYLTCRDCATAPAPNSPEAREKAARLLLALGRVAAAIRDAPEERIRALGGRPAP